MTLKSYTDAQSGLTIIDGKESETGGEARKLGLLLPDSKPNLYATITEAGLTLTEDQIRKIIDDPDRKAGRNRFGPDWIKDQNGRGACQGYASAGAVERARVMRGLEWVKLSGDYAYALVNGGRDSGSHLGAGMKACEGGYCTEETILKHGLRHEYRLAKFPAECKTEAVRFKGFEAYVISNELELASACALGFVCVVAVQAGGSGGLDKYGVCQWGNGSGNHAVIVDDVIYHRELGEFLYDDPNSWGTKWNAQGRCYLRFKQHFVKSITVHDFYAIRSTGDDPQGDNPPTPKG